MRIRVRFYSCICPQMALPFPIFAFLTLHLTLLLITVFHQLVVKCPIDSSEIQQTVAFGAEASFVDNHCYIELLFNCLGSWESARTF